MSSFVEINLSLFIFLWYRRNISSRFSSNSEASASELLENFEEVFPWYLSIVCFIGVFIINSGLYLMIN